MSSRSAVLWMTHLWTPELEAEFDRLLRRRPSNTDVWLLLDSRTRGASAIAARYPSHHQYNEQGLFSLPYPRLDGRGLADHPHFPVLDFFHAHPHYDRYWVLEYDVRYTGEWNHFFDSLERYDHDLVTSHIRRFAEEPLWPWWTTLEHPSKAIPPEQQIRSFNVIYRLSRGALEFIQAAQLDGWRGFPEVSFPTLLTQGGFRLLDMGGHGEFVPPELRNRSYTSGATSHGRLSPFGTIRHRPARARSGRSVNKLYHPVKPADLVEPLSVNLRMAATWMNERINDVPAVKALRRMLPD